MSKFSDSGACRQAKWEDGITRRSFVVRSPVRVACLVLAVSESAYYERLKRAQG